MKEYVVDLAIVKPSLTKGEVWTYSIVTREKENAGTYSVSTLPSCLEYDPALSPQKITANNCIDKGGDVGKYRYKLKGTLEITPEKGSIETNEFFIYVEVTFKVSFGNAKMPAILYYLGSSAETVQIPVIPYSPKLDGQAISCTVDSNFPFVSIKKEQDKLYLVVHTENSGYVGTSIVDLKVEVDG